jgi:hypothetical protein
MADEISDKCVSDSIQRVAKVDEAGMPYRIITKAGKTLPLLGQDLFNPMEWHSGDSIEICADTQGPRIFDIRNDRTGNSLVANVPQP